MAGGIAGGAVGLALGRGLVRLVDVEVDSWKDLQMAAPAYLFAGIAALALEQIGVALGTHLANRRLGNLESDFKAAFYSWLGGIVIANEIFRNPSSDSEVISRTTYVIQLSATVLIERLSAARNIRKRTP